jgi:hypothetical protein
MVLTGQARNTGRETTPVLLCTTQIPHGLARNRTRAFAVTGTALSVTNVPVHDTHTVNAAALWESRGTATGACI